ncbi:D-hexose-6-phosphate mutarotase [Psychrobacter lutiphocae]|uniref:D-hexose-6-phosphate mutarotase n=1 Tax=Psychrobacter lutiphocae TaxID=540500 RepID=UPI00037CAF27|nr:D-hexose-6-phosphate mutarotase [Psychrobacter lutiphocae]
MPVTLNHNKIGELDTLTISGEGYRAVVLLQGAQLIHFMTDNGADAKQKAHSDFSDNWLWVSEQAEYKKGVSVRGGVPICWPVFGMFEANPPAVKTCFADCPFDITQHGYADIQPFVMDSFDKSLDNNDFNSKNNGNMDNDNIHFPLNGASQLVLKLMHDKTPSVELDLKVKFNFSQQGFAINLITQNNAQHTVHFSQALHTYLPTADIINTHIAGFDSISYSDALTKAWNTSTQTVTQHGDISFAGEVDRIYHAAPDIILNTPAHIYQLTAMGSNSTVVWNPWVDTAKQVSQFANDAYQRMLCIETANAHLDYVTLGAGEAWEMGVWVRRKAV